METAYISSVWMKFAKPVKYRITHTPYRIDEGWLLAWRIRYAHQPKAFEPLEIEAIEYLDHCGDIVVDVELVEG